MRIPTLFLALFLTLLPDSVSFFNTASYGQEICFEEICDTEEEAILRAPQRINDKIRASSESVFSDRKFVFIPLFHYRSIHFCFERLWLSACMLRL